MKRSGKFYHKNEREVMEGGFYGWEERHEDG